MDRLLSLIRDRTTVVVRGSAITLQCESSEHALDIIDCIDGLKVEDVVDKLRQDKPFAKGDLVVCELNQRSGLTQGQVYKVLDTSAGNDTEYIEVDDGSFTHWDADRFRHARQSDLRGTKHDSYRYAIDDGSSQFVAAAKPDEFVYPEFPPEVMEKLLGPDCFTEADIQGYVQPPLKLQIETNVDGHWKITINGEVRGHYSSAKVLAEHFHTVTTRGQLRRLVKLLKGES